MDLMRLTYKKQISERRNMDRPRRNFDPSMSKRYGWKTFDPDKLVKYSPKWEYSRLHHFPYKGANWRPRMKSIVVATDGGSRGKNRSDPTSRAAYGVFFGPRCRHNTYGLLDLDAPQSSSRAELEAVRRALEVIQSRKGAGELDGWREVIIKVDSVYVAKSLSEWVWKWEENAWTTNHGRPVEHAAVIREIHRRIRELEHHGAVRFWTVRREWNQDADALVEQAFDGDSDSDTS